MKHKVLWIEDGAFAELQNMSSPIYVSGKYDLVIAIDATAGLQNLRRTDKEFEAIVVDIRLPPGSDPDFQRLYHDRGASRVSSRLGLALLKRVLQQGEENGIPECHREPWRFGVFTVEGYGEMEGDLEQLGIEVYQQKTELLDRLELRKVIEEIRTHRKSAKS